MLARSTRRSRPCASRASGSLDIDPANVNVNGSGCFIGHPIAATGDRMLATLIYQLRRQGGGLGVAAMCGGGGVGGAIVVEVPAR